MERDDYLEAAQRIGRRIVKQAQWEGPVCTWEVQAFDHTYSDQKRSVPAQAEGSLYQGTAGIAFLLGELFRTSGEREVARTAEGAIRHALRYAHGIPKIHFGFHNGLVGIAYVAARLGEILDRPELGDEALQIVLPLAGTEGQDRALDVIGGAAGAIPALLQLATQLESEPLLEMAVALGDHLIATAHREPGGWSWGGPNDRAPARYLTGLAHGAAGEGLALLELFYATGRGKYRFAAEMAFVYERQFFDETTSNWADLRHTQVGDYTYYGRVEELRQAAAAGAIGPYQRKDMTAWCHGSPGIGLARVRAFELTGRPVYKLEATAALRSTLDGLVVGSGAGFSLCHGKAGNCDLPLYAATVFDDPSLRQACEQCAADGWERYELAGEPWPCGTAAGVPDPSLMLGEAGIAYFYLRLYDPETPSILLLRPPHEPREEPEERSFEALRQEAVEEYFGQTLRSFAALGQGPESLSHAGDAGSPMPASPVEDAYETLCQRVDQEPGPRQAQLADAFQRERERYEMTLGISDFTVEYLRTLIRPPTAEVQWQNGRFRLPDDSRLVTTRWDWETWLAARQENAEAELPAAEVHSLLYLRDHRIRVRRFSPFAAVILHAVTSPSSLAEIVDRVASALEGAGEIDREKLAEKVLDQVRELYEAGLVDWSAAPTV